MAAPSRRLGEWLCEPANAQRVVDEVAEVAAIALSKVRDEHIESLVARRADPAVPRGADLAAAGRAAVRGAARQPPPRPGRPRADRAARLAGREPGHRRRGDRRAGAVVGAAAAQRGGHRPDPRRAGPLGRRHPRRPAPPRPAGARLGARPARLGPAVRPGDAGPGRGAQGPAARPPAGRHVVHLALGRAAPGADHLAGGPDRRRPAADAHRGDAVRRPADRRTRSCAPGSTRWRRTPRCSSWTATAPS